MTTTDRDTYAIEEAGTILVLCEHPDDSAAQEWARRQVPGILVVLDLADDEVPSVGDQIDIDDDGVATLA